MKSNGMKKMMTDLKQDLKKLISEPVVGREGGSTECIKMSIRMRTGSGGGA